MHGICKPVTGVFKDVFGTRKASFEEEFLNQKPNVREKMPLCMEHVM